MSVDGPDDEVLELEEADKVASDPSPRAAAKEAPPAPASGGEPDPAPADSGPSPTVAPPPRPRAIAADPVAPEPRATLRARTAGPSPVSVADVGAATQLVEQASTAFASFGASPVPVDFEKSLADLTQAERRVVIAAAAGEAADLSEASDRDVRAFVVRRLMLRLPALSGAPPWPLVGPGVRIRGARIVGAIDLEDGAGFGGGPMAPLILERCELPAPLRLSGARLARLSLNDSRLTELDAGGVRIEGRLDAARIKPLETTAHLFLNGARIAGDVSLEGARLVAPKRATGEAAALDLHGAQVDGRVLARRDFHCDGKIWLNSATVKGNVDFTRALIVQPAADVEADAEAINLAQAQIGGSVLFFAATVSGVTNLRHARVLEDVRIVESTLTNPSRERTRRALALQASEIETEGSVILREAEIEGVLRIASARIGERIELRRCRVDGDVNCSDVRVAGDFEWRGLTLARPLDAPAPRFSLAGARVERLIYATRFSAPSGGVIDMTGARAGALHDRVDHAWGEEGDKTILELEGFTYGSLEAPDGETRGGDVVSARMNWLQRQPRKQRETNPQPYAQLAQALRASGHRRDASEFELKSRILAARARGRGPMYWVTNVFWGVPFGHGLRPERAVFTLALFYLAGVAIAWGVDVRGMLAALGPDGVEAACPASPSPWLYALDMLAPIVELDTNEADGCRISRASAEGFAWRIGTAVYQIVGLVLIFLTVLTFTGAVRRDGDR